MSFVLFFPKIQEQGWYQELLNPVVDQVEPKSTLLDIGTGSGKLLQRLCIEKMVLCTGTDSNSKMLMQARKKLMGFDVKLVKNEINTALPLASNLFDSVCFCNVLFLLDEVQIQNLLHEAIRVLKAKGQIVVLSPSGIRDYKKLLSVLFPISNVFVLLWYCATRRRGRQWMANHLLRKFCALNNLIYSRKFVFGHLGILETLQIR